MRPAVDMTKSNEFVEPLLDAGFKPVPGGYVFTVQQLLGPRRFYLVNEAQKAELMARRRVRFQRMRPLIRLFSASFVALCVAAGISIAFFGWLAIGVFVVLALLMWISWFAFTNISTVRALGPFLATLPPSPEPVTYRAEFKRTVEGMDRALSLLTSSTGATLEPPPTASEDTRAGGLMATLIRINLKSLKFVIGPRYGWWIAGAIALLFGAAVYLANDLNSSLSHPPQALSIPD